MKKFYALAAAACLAFGANAQLYVCGSGTVNGTETLAWTPETPVTINTNADGDYEFTYTMEGGFKMSTVSGTWDEWNTGALYCNIATEKFTKGEPKVFELEANSGPNILCPSKIEWKFVVSSDLTKVTITALEDIVEEDIAIFIRGDVNGWGADDMWKFDSSDNKHFTFVAKGETMIPAAVNFKIADASWALYNFGVGAEIWPSEDGDEWFSGGENTTLGEDFEGTIKFELGDAPSDPIIVQWFANEFGGVENITIDENAPKTYYNLQGIEVENPANGLYIVKQGNKVAKQVIR